MQTLLETLAAELERPRELAPRVVSNITETYSIDRETVGHFLTDELPKLEDYEIDLILSPVFTPKLADQAVFADLLGADSVPREQWPGLVQQLVARPTRAQLITIDNKTHSVILREVSIERYVHRLRLEAGIPESLFKLLDQTSSADRPLLKAVARRAVWENDSRRDILVRYLKTATVRDVYQINDAVALLDLVESYKPTDVANLLARIPHLQQVLQQEINASYSPKPFFSGRVEQSHGGERDRRRQDDTRVVAKKNELAFLSRIVELLGNRNQE